MFKQGNIVIVDLSPTKGHEQNGKRPVVIVSGNSYNQKMNEMAVVMPISNTENDFPLHIPIPEGNPVTGKVLTQHVKTLDLKARGYKVVGELDKETLSKCIKVMNSITTST